jgi:hypothetical protein
VAKPLPTPTRHQIDAGKEVELARIRERNTARILDALVGIAKTALRVAGWCFVAYCVKESVFAIAGTDTTFSAVLKATLSMSADRYAAYALSAISTGTAIYQRRVRLKTTKEQGEHIRALEQGKDPRRSSSGLLPDGRPKKEDLDAS